MYASSSGRILRILVCLKAFSFSYHSPYRLVLRIFQTSFYPSVLQRVRSHLLTSKVGEDDVSSMKSFGDGPFNAGDDTKSKTSTAT